MWYKFYNSGTNLPVGNNYKFIPQNIQEQLSKGYAFVDVITHGGQNAWGTESTDFYTSNEANDLENKGYTIITTSSCLTNAFDYTKELNADPCLSESFIRNNNSGVIAYWGCSREGWDNYGNTPGTSSQYTSQFYENLFSHKDNDKNFGYISALAKSYFINSSKINSSYRWVQLGLNAVGDPEMPIYTDTPKEFNDAKIEITGIGQILVDTGIDNTTICISSNEGASRPYFYVINNKRHVKFSGLPEKVTICIKKQNYIPKLYNISTTYIQNENLATKKIIRSDAVCIGSNITDTPHGPVIISAPSIRIYGKKVIMTPEITIEKNCDFKMTNIK